MEKGKRRHKGEIGGTGYAGLQRKTGIAEPAETGKRRGWVEDRELVKKVRGILRCEYRSFEGFARGG
jgi:hypothetical protein